MNLGKNDFDISGGITEEKKQQTKKINPFAIALIVLLVLLAVRIITVLPSAVAESGMNILMIILILVFGYVFNTAIPSGILMFGIWMIFGYPKKLAAKRANCTQAVEAYVSEYQKTQMRGTNSNGEEETTDWYSPVYEYSYDNFNFKTVSEERSTKIPEVGGHVKLLINPYYPTEIYEIEKEHDNLLATKVCGIIFAVIGGISLLVMLFYVGTTGMFL